ncbi:MAG: hypothetical protein N3H31_04165 [Candidatus Nezhaarchaeota archaeon]|nr:hypothetical protein [Candidatus Nezhaarchaeota archaeon]
MIDWSAVGSLIARAYGAFEDLITGFLINTLFKAKPELASQFSGPLSLLISLTVLYLLLTLVTAAKKVIGTILAIGWVLLIVAIALATAFLA